MALFTSAYSALTFAYHFNGTNVVTPSLGLPTQGNGRGLGGLDGAAEAGNIKRIVSGFGADCQAVIVARFMPDRMVCNCGRQCCKGWYTNLGWISALRHIAEMLKQDCFNGSGDAEYRKDIVAQYFLKKQQREHMDEIAGRLMRRSRDRSVSTSTAYRHLKAVTVFLRSTKTRKGAEQVYLDAVDAELRRAGIVGDE